MFAFKGPADLTFDDHNCLFVPADRVLVTMTEDGAGALRISPGHLPPMTEIVTALASGPFVLTFDGGMLSCKPRHWIVRETTDSQFEMLLVFEPQYGLTPTG